MNPVEYLADVLPQLARTIRLGDVPAMLPKRRIAEQPLPNQNWPATLARASRYATFRGGGAV